MTEVPGHESDLGAMRGGATVMVARRIRRSRLGASSAALLALAVAAAGCTGPSPTAPTASAPSNSVSTSSSPEPHGALTPQDVEFGGGDWLLTKDAAWLDSDLWSTVEAGLPNDVELIGVWTIGSDPNDLASAASMQATDVDDAELEELATNALASSADADEVSDPVWGETSLGYKAVRAQRDLTVDDHPCLHTVRVVLHESRITYAIALSCSSPNEANAAVDQLTNSIRPVDE